MKRFKNAGKKAEHMNYYYLSATIVRSLPIPQLTMIEGNYSAVAISGRTHAIFG